MNRVQKGWPIFCPTEGARNRCCCLGSYSFGKKTHFDLPARGGGKFFPAMSKRCWNHAEAMLTRCWNDVDHRFNIDLTSFDIASTSFRHHRLNIISASFENPFGSAKTDPVRFKWGFAEGLLKDKLAFFKASKQQIPKRRKLLAKRPFS